MNFNLKLILKLFQISIEDKVVLKLYFCYFLQITNYKLQITKYKYLMVVTICVTNCISICNG
jgi:hypothetical protein